MKAFILAGGKGNKVKLEGYENKVLLPIEGKIMLQYIIDALRESSYIDSIAIVGDPLLLKDKILIEDRDVILQEEGMMIDNVVKGLNYFKDQEKVLIITSDIPFITPIAIDHFIKTSLESQGDLTYPIITKETQLQTFPDMERTYVKLREGTFTGGNMFLINPAITDRCVPMARHMIHNRKKPWKMCRMFGFGFVLQLFTGSLTIEKLEKRLGDLYKIAPKAIITPYAEVGNDVDKPSDVILAKKYLALAHNK